MIPTLAAKSAEWVGHPASNIEVRRQHRNTASGSGDAVFCQWNDGLGDDCATVVEVGNMVSLKSCSALFSARPLRRSSFPFYRVGTPIQIVLELLPILWDDEVSKMRQARMAHGRIAPVFALLFAAFGVGILHDPIHAQTATPQAQASQDKIPSSELAEIRAILKELDPPATAEEALLFRQFKDKPNDVQGFIITRKYMRLLGYPAHFMNGLLPSTAPKVPLGTDYKYTLSFDEEFPLFQIILTQGIPSKPPQ